jgi:pimeloyl-ACP methyl ester carboxylesterase
MSTAGWHTGTSAARGQRWCWVHGLGGNLAHWGLVAPLLQGRYRLIAIDLPSHGASTAPAIYSFDHDLGAMDEVRQKLRLDRPALVGHSYGGMLAVSLGASRPSDYRVVVNVDGLGFALDTEREPESHTEELSGEASVNEGDAEWLEAEVNREVEEAASIGLRLDRTEAAERNRRSELALPIGSKCRRTTDPEGHLGAQGPSSARLLRKIRLREVESASRCR